MSRPRFRSYAYTSPIVVLLLSLAHSSGAAAVLPTQGQGPGMLEVTVQVDGLSCPFCAYGLEKRLRKVENVAQLEIYVDEGRAVVLPEEGRSLDLEELERAVRDGGFTPRRIELVARGQLSEFNAVPAIALPDNTVLLLADTAETHRLLESVKGTGVAGADRVIRVEGQAELRAADGHTGHPYTLVLSSFETA